MVERVGFLMNMFLNNKKNMRGFTLIELLIVITIIAIVAAVVFVALDPLTRFQDARDASRWSSVSALITAIKINQVDNGGYYTDGIQNDTSGAAVVAGTEYMISDSATLTGCNVAACSAVADTDDCVDLSDLVTDGYLGNLPVSPDGVGSWSSTYTGYYMTYSPTGFVTISSCEAENTDSISITR